MSWSVSSVGKAAAVKAALAKQFEGAKASTASVPEEQQAVGQAEVIVNQALDFLVGYPNLAVRVEGSGSAYRGTTSAAFNFKLAIEPIYGFVE